MNAIAPILIVVAILAAVMLAALLMVIIGIHGDERRKSLADEPRTLSAIVARWVTGAHSDHHSTDRRSRRDTEVAVETFNSQSRRWR